MAEAVSRNAVVTGAAGGMGRAITKAQIAEMMILPVNRS